MVKLASVRSNRVYGSRRESYELANAVSYLVGAILIFVGVVFQLPSFNNVLGLALLLLALLVFVAVNLHDLHAHLGAIGFRMDRLRPDLQFVLVELTAPFLYALGSALMFVGVLFLLRISHGAYTKMDAHSAYRTHSLRLLVFGTLLWVIASILNNFQVYQRAPLQLQAYQKSILISFLISSLLFYIGALLGLGHWPRNTIPKIQSVGVWMSLVASALLVLAAILNIAKLTQMHHMERAGIPLEPIRGQATEAEVTRSEPLLGPTNVDIVPETTPYTTVVEPERLY